MSCEVKYIGMDVHKEAGVIAVLTSSGKLVMESIVEAKNSQHRPADQWGMIACELARSSGKFQRTRPGPRP